MLRGIQTRFFVFFADADFHKFSDKLMQKGIDCPVVLSVESHDSTIDEQLIHFSTQAGALFLDGMGDGIWLMNDPAALVNQKVSGRTYLETKNKVCPFKIKAYITDCI